MKLGRGVSVGVPEGRADGLLVLVAVAVAVGVEVTRNGGEACSEHAATTLLKNSRAERANHLAVVWRGLWRSRQMRAPKRKARDFTVAGLSGLPTLTDRSTAE